MFCQILNKLGTKNLKGILRTWETANISKEYNSKIEKTLATSLELFRQFNRTYNIHE